MRFGPHVASPPENGSNGTSLGWEFQAPAPVEVAARKEHGSGQAGKTQKRGESTTLHAASAQPDEGVKMIIYSLFVLSLGILSSEWDFLAIMSFYLIITRELPAALISTAFSLHHLIKVASVFGTYLECLASDILDQHPHSHPLVVSRVSAPHAGP